jgi:hypothetical protein
MNKTLAATVMAVSLIATTAHANFQMRGVMSGLLDDNGGVSCSRYNSWMKTHPNEREIMSQWILGFYSGVESQISEKPEHAKATGSEHPPDSILNMVKSFCKENPKQAALAIIQAGVEYWLNKPGNPRYDHGFNVHGVLAKNNTTCQNLIMEIDGEWSSGKSSLKVAPASTERKFLLEEWMLGFASGVESQVFHGKPLKTDKVSNEELLDSIYAACRTNPTEYAFKVVLDQELANISMLQQATTQSESVN